MTEIPEPSPIYPDTSSGENKTEEWQHETIKFNDVITIPVGTAQPRADVFGGEVIAKFALGGHKDGTYPQQHLNLIAVNRKEDQDFQKLVNKARTAGQGIERAISNLLLIAYEPGSGIIGTAFVPEHRSSTLGREGDLHWFDYPVSDEPTTGQAPFAENNSISRSQLAFHPRYGKLFIVGVTKKSATEIDAPYIKKEGR